MTNDANLKWDAQGLIPAVVQDADTGQVLMVAWMNAEALARTRSTGQTHFWSRSRGQLWHKGGTSGNTQDVVSIHADCDGDTLLVQVRPAGPACHTGETSCFFRQIEFRGEHMAQFNFIDELFDLIQDRKAHPVESSYTNKLFDSGVSKIAQKIGEEAVEVVVAALSQSEPRVIEELADLMYHCLVLMSAKGVTPDMVRNELERRHWPREGR